MPRIDTIDVPFWVISAGVAVAGFGFVVAFWAIFGDAIRRTRSKVKPPRCPRCWYNMTGAAGLRCPECGYDVKHPAELSRWRRRWIRCALGLVTTGVGVAAYFAPTLVNLPWIPAIPTPILIWLVQDPVTPAPIWAFGNPGGKPNSLTVRQGLAFELWRRYADDSLSLEQRREVARKQFLGRPPLVLKSRPRWPDGIPIYFRTHWSFCGVKERRLEATMRGRPFTESLTARPRWFLLRDAVGWPEHALTEASVLREIDNPTADLTEIAFDVTIYEDEDKIWEGVATAPTAIGEDVDKILEPVEDSKWPRDVALERAITVANGWVGMTPPLAESLDGVTMALWFELMLDGEVIAATPIVWTYPIVAQSNPQPALQPGATFSRIGGFQFVDAAVPTTNPGRVARKWVAFGGDTSAFDAAPESKPGWSLRVRGDGALAVRDLGTTRYWKGDFTLSPAEFESHAQATPGSGE